jgi:hypothetical protein
MRTSALIACAALVAVVGTTRADSPAPLTISYGIVIRDDARNSASYRLNFRGIVAAELPGPLFVPKLDQVSFGVGPVARLTFAPRSRGLHVKVRKKGTHVVYVRPHGVKTWLRRLDVNFATGVVRVVARGMPLGDSGASPGGVALSLRLGALEYAGVLGGTGEVGEGDPGQAGTAVPFTRLDSSMYSFVDNASTAVVEDVNAWASVWSSYCHDLLPRPEIDFATNRVAVVFLGEREAKNYDVQITNVLLRGDALFVQYTETRPSGQCYSVFEPISLAAFAAIPRGQGSTVTFEHLVHPDCIAGR